MRRTILGDNLLRVHHIGSTAIPYVVAKPIVICFPSSLVLRNSMAAGKAWRLPVTSGMGPYGLPQRRYCVRDDPESGGRLFQVHCFADGSSEIVRHLAFRDYLIAHPTIAEDYSAEKLRCRNLHAQDSHAYGDCKSAWVSRTEIRALGFYHTKSNI